MRNHLNPWREGDFLIYAEAELISPGKWAAFFWIDHHPEGGHLLRRAVERRRFGKLTYSSRNEAVLNGISWGQNWVQSLTDD